MTIQLSEQELSLIKSILQKHLPKANFYLFGSRATGKAKKYSDVDILIISDGVIPLTILSALNEDFSESPLPYKVDIVDWERITPEFRNKIESEKISL